MYFLPISFVRDFNFDPSLKYSPDGGGIFSSASIAVLLDREVSRVDEKGAMRSEASRRGRDHGPLRAVGTSAQHPVRRVPTEESVEWSVQSVCGGGKGIKE